MLRSTQEMKSPDNFRTLNIYPNHAEILGARIQLRKNIVEGKFEDVEHYLDVQFRLLREDFVACAREGVQSYRLQKSTKSIDVYNNVRVFKDRIKHNEECVKIKIPPLEEDSKKFMNGSLLIFTKNNFDTILLAKVVHRNLEKCEVKIDMIDCNNNVLVGQQSYSMAEVCTYFDPYFHVLNILQTMSSVELPMQKYIIHVDTSSVYIPKYLLYSSSYKIGKYSLPPEMLPRFLENDNGLNEAQFTAFKAALSQEFVVIQGPPGTGKTFLGLKIVETLVQNWKLWYGNSPILVISQKNHALDQFLEGLIAITRRVVRVGSQSKSDKLREFNLANENSKVATGHRRGDYLKRMQEALIVGMTTSIAARWKDYLEKLRCPIVIVEEAAEVLEAHVVAALTKHCQHLILLGDHQQLQPITSDYTIGNKYHLGVSLFERMINNGIQCYTLTIQHRMRPEISSLLKSRIYPFLEDHESTLKRPRILGVDNNLFFLDHRHPEEDANVTSKKNTHEAAFLAALAKHLILNGYEPENIVILATYSAQVQEIERVAETTSNKRYLQHVKISTLDAFQGQEADIVLFSLVRSEGIGFLSIQNRVCVALSRARNGFFLVGNMELLAAKSELWRSVKKCLERQRSIGDKLVLTCRVHPERAVNVRFAEDFLKMYCSHEAVLECGHFCNLLCHASGEGRECERICKKKGRGVFGMATNQEFNHEPQEEPDPIIQLLRFVGKILLVVFQFLVYVVKTISQSPEPERNRRRRRERRINM